VVLPTPALVLHADPLGLLVAFGAGMLSFVSPCVLPLVPAYVSMVSGLSAAELSALGAGRGVVAVPTAGPLPATGVVPSPTVPATGVVPSPTVPATSAERTARARAVRGILAFIAGFTAIFVALGAGSSVLGQLLTTHRAEAQLASGVVVVGFGSVLVALAVGVRLPRILVAERRLSVSPSALGAWAPPVLGMAFAFAWTPCIGPVLGSVLVIAGGTGRGTPLAGVALLFAYALGLGVPFLLSGVAFGRMTDVLARLRPRLGAVNLVGGAVLVAFGLLLMTGHVDVVSSQFSTWLRDLHLSRLATS
jgi:cytochrome c-type biogenesis protein